MRKLLASLVITLSAAGAAHADLQSDADAAAGRDKAQACAACHGQEGIGISPAFPNLAGQQASYLAKQIMDIRDGNRNVPQMAGQVDGFSDQDAWNVAAYFAGMEPALGQADPDTELVQQGRELYRAGDLESGLPACAACHSPTGSGIGSAAYPALSGQQRDYVVSTLQAFAAGERANDPNAIMRDIAAKMGDRDMNAVANYVHGLH
ncbi:c-type cytochrome [Halomonas organivorans]|uniref:Cytochrome c553 n=1 Tax=Halomonas organivorans TaxID=257772 RepID=A0A7W5BY62_9GAMM|nr:c-type cytochrome [Halomonas organivorans]MBB3141342.1 cytochrome c553 [Halomonas organivorans]